jgi:hypothetical protein
MQNTFQSSHFSSVLQSTLARSSFHQRWTNASSFFDPPVDVARYSQLPHASAKTTVLPLDAAFDSHIGSNQGSNMLENVSITASSQRPYTYDADMAGANVRATAITWT